MRTAVVTVRPEAQLAEAAQLMKDRQVRHLPAVDEAGRLVGIVTDRDLRQAIFDPAIRERVGKAAEALAELPVREVMTWGVVTVGPDTDLRFAARVMREQKVGALPVVDGGKLVGLVTETDLLAALEEALRRHVQGPRPLATTGEAEESDHGVLAPDLEDFWRNDGAGG
jgi:acetoin utilization protein AcuB